MAIQKLPLFLDSISGVTCSDYRVLCYICAERKRARSQLNNSNTENFIE